MDKEYAKYLLKKTVEDYDLIAEEFSRTREKPWPEIKFLFDDYLIPGDKVLDLGCGNGRMFEFFQDKNIDYVGIDSSEKLIELAKKRYPGVRFELADALNLPFLDNSFDKVYSFAVLHHIPSEELRLRFLEEARRVLRPGGKIILTVWNLWQRRGLMNNLKYALSKILGLSKLDFKDVFVPWGKISQRYFHCFTKGELKKIAEKLDLKVEMVEIVKRQMGKGTNIYIIAVK